MREQDRMRVLHWSLSEGFQCSLLAEFFWVQTGWGQTPVLGGDMLAGLGSVGHRMPLRVQAYLTLQKEGASGCRLPPSHPQRYLAPDGLSPEQAPLFQPLSLCPSTRGKENTGALKEGQI